MKSWKSRVAFFVTQIRAFSRVQALEEPLTPTFRLSKAAAVELASSSGTGTSSSNRLIASDT